MEIKNITKYNEELLKKFLKVYYFDKIKTVRIIMNILILIVVIRFFIKKDIDALDIITFIFALFGIIEINTNMLPQFNLYRIKKKKDSILNTKIKYYVLLLYIVFYYTMLILKFNKEFINTGK